jgi:hypothetical protein
LFVLLVIRAALMVPDQCGDLVGETDRWAADQLPGGRLCGTDWFRLGGLCARLLRGSTQ